MSIRVVVVDNSEELLLKLTGILKDMSEIELCGSFPEAITAMQYIKANPVDLVFSDIVMPDISGITLASKLYELLIRQKLCFCPESRGFHWKHLKFVYLHSL